MITLLAIAAVLSMIVGVAFLFAAALGVMRFADPLQRMHASTKAGTVGAVFVLIGTVLTQEQSGSTLIGVLAIAFLLLTVPVAAHLLGRAVYVSGAHLRGVMGRDALRGHLPRRLAPLERRTEFLPPERFGVRSVSGQEIRSAQDARPELTEVRFALIAPEVDAVIARSQQIALKQKVPLSAFAVIDEGFLEASRSPNITRPMVRERVAKAVARLHESLPTGMDQFSLVYEEGDPMELIPDREHESSLLVLPARGWCHHGVDVPTPHATGRPEGLLRLASFHVGPVLYVGEKSLPQAGSKVAVIDDGSNHLLGALIWALRTGLWENAKVYLVGRPTQRRLDRIAAALSEVADGFGFEVLPEDSPGLPLLPPQAADFDAVVTPALPRPMRTDWYGMFWHQQIAEGWKGEVFLVPRRS